VVETSADMKITEEPLKLLPAGCQLVRSTNLVNDVRPVRRASSQRERKSRRVSQEDTELKGKINPNAPLRKNKSTLSFFSGPGGSGPPGATGVSPQESPRGRRLSCSFTMPNLGGKTSSLRSSLRAADGPPSMSSRGDSQGSLGAASSCRSSCRGSSDAEPAAKAAPITPLVSPRMADAAPVDTGSMLVGSTQNEVLASPSAGDVETIVSLEDAAQTENGGSAGLVVASIDSKEDSFIQQADN